MDWLISVYSAFASLAVKCYQFATSLEGWGWPVNKLAPFFNAIGGIFQTIYNGLVSFYFWARNLDDRIKNFITTVDLWSLLSSPLSQLAQLWGWFLDRVNSIRGIVDQWWVARKWKLQEWVRTLVSGVSAAITDLQRLFNGLSVAWESFKVDLLSLIPSWTELRDFINTQLNAIKDWFAVQRQAISGEIEANVKPIRDQVNKQSSWLDLIKAFINDPEDFLYKAVDRVIERFW